MSTRVRGWRLIIGRGATWKRVGVRTGRVNRFSQCARLGDEKQLGEQPGSQTSEEQTTKEGQQQQQISKTSDLDRHERSERGHKNSEQQQQQTKRSGFRLPALALFAAALPVGYYLSDYVPTGRRANTADKTQFVKYTLLDKENVSSTCAIFRLKPSSSEALDLNDPALERAITSVEFKQPQLQIARSYTCLPQVDGQHEDELRFLIRKEQKGEVSTFLHKLPANAEIQARGLNAEYVLPEDVKSVAFLVGGTGIAPAMQAVDVLDGQANVHILWASRRREDCIGGYNDTTPESRSWSFWPLSKAVAPSRMTTDLPYSEKGALVNLLEGLKTRFAQGGDRASRLSVDYYVDEEGTFIRPDDVKHVLYKLSRLESSSTGGRKMLFVSGPEGFMSYWAGPKQWSEGREIQGPLRGILSTLDLHGWEVVKL